MGPPAAMPAQQVQHLLYPHLSGLRYACTVINIIPNTAIITHLEFIMWSNLNKWVIGAGWYFTGHTVH